MNVTPQLVSCYQCFLTCTLPSLQVATINVVFIATGGNLAASYAAALANQLLISAWQRLGAQRMQQVRAGVGVRVCVRVREGG